MTQRPQNLGLIQGEADLKARLQPVVIGADILGYSYVREYREAYGIRPLVISAVDMKVTSSSRFCDYRVDERCNDEDGLVELLSEVGREIEAAGKVGFVHGSADFNTRILSKHKDELSRWYVVPYVDFDLLEDITQKERFYQICESLGIAYPKTWYLDCAHPEQELDVSQFPYPCIAKPSNSATYDLLEFVGKKKIYEIATPEEMAHVWDVVSHSGYQHKLVVQDFVPGDDDAIRSLTTFSDAEGKLRVVSGGRVVLQDHSPLALGNPVCILSEKVQRVVDDAAKFLKATGYHGYANFDIKYDARDGQWRFFEVNTRPGKNTYYVSLGGTNFVRPLVEDWVLGREVAYNEAYDPFVYTVVPASVVERTVRDEDLKAKVLGMYKQGLAKSPWDYRPDTLRHKFWERVMWEHEPAKFKKYVWDTGGKQADVD